MVQTLVFVIVLFVVLATTYGVVDLITRHQHDHCGPNCPTCQEARRANR